MPSAPEPVPVPIRVLLPGDQEVVAHLWSRRQARDGWRYEVLLPAYRNGPGNTVEPAAKQRLAVGDGVVRSAERLVVIRATRHRGLAMSAVAHSRSITPYSCGCSWRD
ncbi:hypothetical protein ACE1SV_64200 [Streptomyces sp. E-15]